MPLIPRELAVQLAQQASGIMRSHFGLGMKKDWKRDNSPVTAADLAINKLVLKSIKQHFPEHKILAEEGSDFSGKDNEYVWVCDPIDGTIPFSHGIPISMFALALVKNGEPILGVTYDPVLDRMFVAEKGKGAYLNDKKIHVSSATTLKNATIEIEWSKKNGWVDLFPIVKPLCDRGAKQLIFASIVYSTSLVATGEFIATIFPGVHAHDSAATKIIVEEAGGKVTSLFGDEQRYDRRIKGCLASNGLVHDQLLALIKKTLK